jgi:hypothetical protein
MATGIQKQEDCGKTCGTAVEEIPLALFKAAILNLASK